MGPSRGTIEDWRLQDILIELNSVFEIDDIVFIVLSICRSSISFKELICIKVF